jgi:hypothetical protein
MSATALLESTQKVSAVHAAPSSVFVTLPVPQPNTKGWSRRIPPTEGRALEVLGHAIEYLADEFVYHSGSLSSLNSNDPQVQAIQMLKAANRQVYFSCPVVPPVGVRLMNLLFHRNCVAERSAQ